MSANPIPFRSWLRVNGLPVFFCGLMILVEIWLELIPGQTDATILYAWFLDPALFQNTITLVAVLAILFSFMIHNIRWYVRVVVAVMVLVVLPVVIPIARFRLLAGISPIGDVRHESSVTFQGHVYHLTRAFFSGVSFYVHECDSLGLWCHEIDSFGGWLWAGDMALIADSGNDTMSVVWVDPPPGVPNIVRQYAILDSLNAVQPAPSGP